MHRHSGRKSARLHAEPGAALAFIDDVGGSQFSVLLRGRRDGWAAEWEHPAAHGSAVEEVYRVRLPRNRYSRRGVIVGEGKPENQNHAVIFAHGEALQTIDMNQDNNLAEALKMRNLLEELHPTHASRRAPTTSCSSGCLSSDPLSALNDPRATAHDYLAALGKQQRGERPTACIGFREWIYSEKAGALGSFAAAAEFAFGTIMQRTMHEPARVRLHYGHPDLFNKLHTMTRGGFSKALYVSEDIFAGFNALLRGADIKYREYTSVGKGRDMGFDSINAFEIKTSSGAGAAIASRDLWRLATRLDIFRCHHLYYSGLGHYVNTWLLMMTVYVTIFSLLFVSLSGTMSFIYFKLDPVYDRYLIEFSWENTYQAEFILQLGALTVIPYLVELILEHGWASALLTLLHQMVAGSLSFFISRQQTCRVYFESSMQYGGGQYIATGRGFATRTSSFVKLYANYGRTHIIPGLELLSMLVVLYILDDCFACNLALMTWGIWLVAFSLILSPFWFNPNAFELSKVAVDFKALGEWLAGEVSPVTGSSWHTWNRKQLEKVRAGTPSSVIPALVFQATPPLLLAFAAFLRVDLHTDLELPEGMGPEGLNWWLQSRWVIAGLSAIIVWSCLWLSARMLASLKSGGRQRAWRVHVARMCIVAAAVLILYFVVFSQMLGYKGNSFGSLCLLIYANMLVLIAAHRIATHLARGPHSSATVDGVYHFMDVVASHLVLGTVGVMSLIGIIAWAQHRLLFNIGFAQSLQRGRLLQTLRWRRGPNAARGRGGGGIGSGGTAALRPVVVAVPLPAQQPSQGSSGGGGGAAASSSHVRNSQVQHVRISQQHGRRSPRWQVSPLEHVELPMPPIWLAANLGRTQQ